MSYFSHSFNGYGGAQIVEIGEDLTGLQSNIDCPFIYQNQSVALFYITSFTGFMHHSFDVYNVQQL